jgi:hypothetical protein
MAGTGSCDGTSFWLALDDRLGADEQTRLLFPDCKILSSMLPESNLTATKRRNVSSGSGARDDEHERWMTHGQICISLRIYCAVRSVLYVLFCQEVRIQNSDHRPRPIIQLRTIL